MQKGGAGVHRLLAMGQSGWDQSIFAGSIPSTFGVAMSCSGTTHVRWCEWVGCKMHLSNCSCHHSIVDQLVAAHVESLSFDGNGISSNNRCINGSKVFEVNRRPRNAR